LDLVDANESGTLAHRRVPATDIEKENVMKQCVKRDTVSRTTQIS
jgi:hypothetical protein